MSNLDANAILFRLRRMKADARSMSPRRFPEEYHLTTADVAVLDEYVARFYSPHSIASYFIGPPKHLYDVPVVIDDTRPSHLVVEGGIVIESAYDKPKAD